MLYGTYTLVFAVVTALGIGDKPAQRMADFPAKELCEMERAHIESLSKPGEYFLAVCVPSDQK
jgi:hypothetical protein